MADSIGGDADDWPTLLDGHIRQQGRFYHRLAYGVLRSPRRPPTFASRRSCGRGKTTTASASRANQKLARPRGDERKLLRFATEPNGAASARRPCPLGLQR